VAKGIQALKRDDQFCGQKLSEKVKKHSSEAFYALDDLLEAAVFSVPVEMLKVRLVEAKMYKIEKEGEARE
jgi:hypothetical protein